MRPRLWLQMLGLSALISIIFSVLALALFRGVGLRANNDIRYSIYMLAINVLESAPYPESMLLLERFRKDSPRLASNVWIVSDNGRVLATNTSIPLPEEWQEARKPQRIHEMSVFMKPPHLLPELTLIRLDARQPVYAVIRSLPSTGALVFQILLFVFGMFGAAAGGLAMTFLYLRRTSLEAKQVMTRLHAGDLQARFRIHKLDEVGNLKLDFNAMADEIEKLVIRVANTDLARKNLLQELSHDLRTPLTSLRTAVETLIAYRAQMTPGQQEEMLGVMQTELDYFVHLLDDLFFIADIAEPGHRSTLEPMDLAAQIRTEIQARQLAQPHLQWRAHCPPVLTLQGDAHLILRLLRNSLDNAARHARSRVEVTARDAGDQIELTVSDDGPGMSSEERRNFGERRKQRIREGSASPNLSLGLGSVIIKTIVALHGGTLRIEDGMDACGTRLVFALPKFPNR